MPPPAIRTDFVTNLKKQPFHSLDFTYAWYATDTFTVKVKAQNLLDETTTIERQGIVVYEEDPGISYSIGFSWAP